MQTSAQSKFISVTVICSDKSLNCSSLLPVLLCSEMDVLCYFSKNEVRLISLQLSGSSFLSFLQLGVTSARDQIRDPPQNTTIFQKLWQAFQAHQPYLSAPVEESHPALHILVHFWLPTQHWCVQTAGSRFPLRQKVIEQPFPYHPSPGFLPFRNGLTFSLSFFSPITCL